jgi:hypothetical protein
MKCDTCTGYKSRRRDGSGSGGKNNKNHSFAYRVIHEYDDEADDEKERGIPCCCHHHLRIVSQDFFYF